MEWWNNFLLFVFNAELLPSDCYTNGLAASSRDERVCTWNILQGISEPISNAAYMLE